VQTRRFSACARRPCALGLLMTSTQALTKTARKTINAQLAARREELRTCRTAAQVSSVLREVERLQAILTRGAWV